ncbi:hypothetical protein HMPREF0765_3077 [Sphingobacterium spiritivorum ATCC 33300]|uniref:Cyclic nucleotide-binding domain protein n=1 Tax=Sphingobacterium spiritivorum ATCC 33300 TaxID=525372 RepID=C2G0H7_SPHSI|nr:Crp/Fnr family transcriptional regulator [Sphingobacterium spiritivorum]EEI91357.1 hypothetical protein HMPREF0765_3077 [Sphingobacterium spiritivorum ATCC 33300]QQS97456.1 Crp/Fnr family transcriptional regulator [Sphingobacterium spiritivorum]
MVKQWNSSFNYETDACQEKDRQIAHKAILEIFGNIHPLSLGLKESIRENSKLIYCKKKHILTNFNEVHKNIYFIVRGGIRTYFIDKEGSDITSWLLFENDLAVSVLSFFSQKIGLEAMETIEDSILLSLSHTTLTKMYTEFIEFNFIGRILTEQYYIRSEEKTNAFRILNASERYLDLLKKRPDIINRVPLGYIASYLGITNSTLSRIRRRR